MFFKIANFSCRLAQKKSDEPLHQMIIHYLLRHYHLLSQTILNQMNVLLQNSRWDAPSAPIHDALKVKNGIKRWQANNAKEVFTCLHWRAKRRFFTHFLKFIFFSFVRHFVEFLKPECLVWKLKWIFYNFKNISLKLSLSEKFCFTRKFKLSLK